MRLQSVLLDVTNGGVYWQVKRSVYGGHAGVWDVDEVYTTPGSRSVPQSGLTGIRVRAAIPAANLPAGAKQAVVTVTAYTMSDAS